MGVKIREKRGKLYLDVYTNGKRRWEALGLSMTSDKQQNREIMRLAELCRSKREMQILSGEWGLLDPVGGKKALYTYLEELGRERDKKDRVNKVLKYLEPYPGGTAIQLGQINERWFEGFQSYLEKESGLSKNTANSYAFAVRLALNKAVHENLIPRNPSESVKSIRTPESDKVYLNPDEIQRLAKTELGGKLGAEVKRAFLFGCFTGLRISDIKTLRWGDIEHNPPQIIKRQEKTDRKVYVPLNDTAWQIINDGSIHKHSEPVFALLARTGTNTNQYITRWAGHAGLEKQIGWHTARHTFATLTLENGADFFTVSKLLGHTKVATTAVYTKATDKLRREAVNALPQISIE